MSQIKWIKLTTNMFDDEKIKLIESLPDKDTILIIWIKLLTQAGKCNATGHLVLSETIAYTDEMLATIFNRPINTVRLALNTFKNFGMIEMDGESYYITNWLKHQNIEGMEKVREDTKKRVQNYRNKQKLLAEKNKNETCNVTDNVTETKTNVSVTHLEEEEEKEKELKDKICEKTKKNEEADKCPTNVQDNKKIDSKKNQKTPYQEILDNFHRICKSFSKVVKFTDERKKVLKNWYAVSDMNEMIKTFELAENSNFLKGISDLDWKADFDWICKPKNRVKILEGNYINKNIGNVKKNIETSEYDNLW